MGNIISNMGLYDLFARGVTGVVVLCAAHVFGIVDILGKPDYVWVLILCGYFLGLILEELSWILEKILHSREKIENKVCNDYPEYDYKKCKDALMIHDKEIVADEPLAHVVMSRSFEIAFILFLVFELLDAVCCNNLISGSFLCSIADVVILAVLILIFHRRANHYCEHRAKNIFDYCIAKDYPNTKKTPNKDKKHET